MRSRSTISGSARFLDFQPHCIALAPVVQLRAHRLQKRARFLFLKIEVAVARDPEGGLRENLVAPVHPRRAALDQIMQKNEVVRCLLSKAAPRNAAERAAP